MSVTPTVGELTLRVKNLRVRQSTILDGATKLLGCGITGHVAEVAERVTAMTNEGYAIAQQLRDLGADAAADDAEAGWPILFTSNGVVTE